MTERFVRFTFTGSPFEAREQLYTRHEVQPAPKVAGPAAASASPTPGMQAHAIDRIHVRRLTPALFRKRFVEKGVPVVIEGLFESDDMSQWQLANFWQLLDEGAPLQCRVHGGDRHATTPSRWVGKTHARRVVTTTGRSYAETIATGVAQREDCYVQSDIRNTHAGASTPNSCLLDDEQEMTTT